MRFFHLKKTLAVGLGVVIFTHSILAPLAEANIWSERKKAREYASLPTPLQNPQRVFQSLPLKNPNFQSSSTRITPKLSKASSSFQRLINAISLNHGTVQEIYEGPTVLQSDSPTSQLAGTAQSDRSTVGPIPIVLIQDIHLNSEAQHNIAGLLQTLIDEGQIGMVGLEGAFTQFDFSELRAATDKVKAKQVADEFLDKNLIAAHSYVGATSATQPPLFVGVDDVQHYANNVVAYQESQDVKKRVQKKLDQAIRDLSEKKKTVLNNSLSEFDALKLAHDSGAIGLGAYVQQLASNTEELNLVAERFLEAYRLESELDFARVDQERQQVLEKLTKKLSDAELSDLLNDSVAYKAGRLGFGDYYNNLKSLCAQKGVSLRQAPAFDRYLQYVLLSDGIKADALFDAVERMEAGVQNKLIRTPEEKNLMEQSEYLSLVGKLIEFSLTAKEWEKYRRVGLSTRPDMGKPSRSPNGHDIARRWATYYVAPTMLRSFERFYEEADIRSERMVANLLKAQEIRNVREIQKKSDIDGPNKISNISDYDRTSRTTVLITGGFHTSEISTHLREKGISYVVVSPRVTKADEKPSAYLSVFAREKNPIEKLFSGEKLFLNSTETASIGSKPLRYTVPVLSKYFQKASELYRSWRVQVNPVAAYSASSGEPPRSPINVSNALSAFFIVSAISALGLYGIPFQQLNGNVAALLKFVFYAMPIHTLDLLVLASMFKLANHIQKEKFQTGPPTILWGQKAYASSATQFIEYNSDKKQFDVNPFLFFLLTHRHPVIRWLTHISLVVRLSPLHEILHARWFHGHGWKDEVAVYSLQFAVAISVMTLWVGSPSAYVTIFAAAFISFGLWTVFYRDVDVTHHTTEFAARLVADPNFEFSAQEKRLILSVGDFFAMAPSVFEDYLAGKRKISRNVAAAIRKYEEQTGAKYLDLVNRVVGKMMRVEPNGASLYNNYLPRMARAVARYNYENYYLRQLRGQASDVDSSRRVPFPEIEAAIRPNDTVTIVGFRHEMLHWVTNLYGFKHLYLVDFDPFLVEVAAEFLRLSGRTDITVVEADVTNLKQLSGLPETDHVIARNILHTLGASATNLDLHSVESKQARQRFYTHLAWLAKKDGRISIVDPTISTNAMYDFALVSREVSNTRELSVVDGKLDPEGSRAFYISLTKIDEPKLPPLNFNADGFSSALVCLKEIMNHRTQIRDALLSLMHNTETISPIVRVAQVLDDAFENNRELFLSVLESAAVTQGREFLKSDFLSLNGSDFMPFGRSTVRQFIRAYPGLDTNGNDPALVEYLIDQWLYSQLYRLRRYGRKSHASVEFTNALQETWSLYKQKPTGWHAAQISDRAMADSYLEDNEQASVRKQFERMDVARARDESDWRTRVELAIEFVNRIGRHVRTLHFRETEDGVEYEHRIATAIFNGADFAYIEVGLISLLEAYEKLLSDPDAYDEDLRERIVVAVYAGISANPAMFLYKENMMALGDRKIPGSRSPATVRTLPSSNPELLARYTSLIDRFAPHLKEEFKNSAIIQEAQENPSHLGSSAQAGLQITAGQILYEWSENSSPYRRYYEDFHNIPADAKIRNYYWMHSRTLNGFIQIACGERPETVLTRTYVAYRATMSELDRKIALMERKASSHNSAVKLIVALVVTALVRFALLPEGHAFIDENFYTVAKFIGRAGGDQHVWPEISYWVDHFYGIKGVRIVSAIFGVATVAAVHKFAERVARRWVTPQRATTAGFMAAIAFGFSSPALLINSLATYDSLAAFFFAVSMWQLVRQRPTRASILVAVFAFVAAAVTRYNLMIFLPFILLAVVFLPEYHNRRNILTVVIPLVIVSAIYYFITPDLWTVIQGARSIGRIASIGNTGGAVISMLWSGLYPLIILYVIAIIAMDKDHTPDNRTMMSWFLFLGATVAPLWNVAEWITLGADKNFALTAIFLSTMIGIGFAHLDFTHKKRNKFWSATVSLLVLGGILAHGAIHSKVYRAAWPTYASTVKALRQFQEKAWVHEIWVLNDFLAPVVAKELDARLSSGQKGLHVEYSSPWSAATPLEVLRLAKSKGVPVVVGSPLVTSELKEGDHFEGYTVQQVIYETSADQKFPVYIFRLDSPRQVELRNQDTPVNKGGSYPLAMPLIVLAAMGLVNMTSAASSAKTLISLKQMKRIPPEFAEFHQKMISTLDERLKQPNSSRRAEALRDSGGLFADKRTPLWPPTKESSVTAGWGVWGPADYLSFGRSLYFDGHFAIKGTGNPADPNFPFVFWSLATNLSNLFVFGATRRDLEDEFVNLISYLYLHDMVYGSANGPHTMLPIALKTISEIPINGKSISLREYFMRYLGALKEGYEAPFIWHGAKSARQHMAALAGLSNFAGLKVGVKGVDLAADVARVLEPSQLITANNAPIRLRFLERILTTRALTEKGRVSNIIDGNPIERFFELRSVAGLRAMDEIYEMTQLVDAVFAEILPSYQRPNITLPSGLSLLDARDEYVQMAIHSNREAIDDLYKNYAQTLGHYLGTLWAVGGTPAGGSIAVRNVGFIKGQSNFQDFDQGLFPNRLTTKFDEGKFLAFVIHRDDGFPSDIEEVTRGLDVFEQVFGIPREERARALNIFFTALDQAAQTTAEKAWSNSQILDPQYVGQLTVFWASLYERFNEHLPSTFFMGRKDFFLNMQRLAMKHGAKPAAPKAKSKINKKVMLLLLAGLLAFSLLPSKSLPGAVQAGGSLWFLIILPLILAAAKDAPTAPADEGDGKGKIKRRAPLKSLPDYIKSTVAGLRKSMSQREKALKRFMIHINALEEKSKAHRAAIETALRESREIFSGKMPPMVAMSDLELISTVHMVAVLEMDRVNVTKGALSGHHKILREAEQRIIAQIPSIEAATTMVDAKEERRKAWRTDRDAGIAMAQFLRDRDALQKEVASLAHQAHKVQEALQRLKRTSKRINAPDGRSSGAFLALLILFGTIFGFMPQQLHSAVMVLKPNRLIMIPQQRMTVRELRELQNTPGIHFWDASTNRARNLKMARAVGEMRHAFLEALETPTQKALQDLTKKVRIEFQVGNPAEMTSLSNVEHIESTSAIYHEKLPNGVWKYTVTLDAVSYMNPVTFAAHGGEALYWILAHDAGGLDRRQMAIDSRKAIATTLELMARQTGSTSTRYGAHIARLHSEIDQLNGRTYRYLGWGLLLLGASAGLGLYVRKYLLREDSVTAAIPTDRSYRSAVYPGASVFDNSSTQALVRPIVSTEKIALMPWAERSGRPFTEEERRVFREKKNVPELKDLNLKAEDIRSIRHSIYDRSSGVIEVYGVIETVDGRRLLFHVAGGDTTAMQALKNIQPSATILRRPYDRFQVSAGNQADLRGNFSIISNGESWIFFGASDDPPFYKFYRALVQMKSGERLIGSIEVVGNPFTGVIEEIELTKLDRTKVTLNPHETESILVAYTLLWPNENPADLINSQYGTTGDLRHMFLFPKLHNAFQFSDQLANDITLRRAAYRGEAVRFKLIDVTGAPFHIPSLVKALKDHGYRPVGNEDHVIAAGDFLISHDQILVRLRSSRYPVNGIAVSADGTQSALVGVTGQSGRVGADYVHIGAWLDQTLSFKAAAFFVLDNGMDPSWFENSAQGWRDTELKGRPVLNMAVTVRAANQTNDLRVLLENRRLSPREMKERLVAYVAGSVELNLEIGSVIGSENLRTVDYLGHVSIGFEHQFVRWENESILNETGHHDLNEELGRVLGYLVSGDRERFAAALSILPPVSRKISTQPILVAMLDGEISESDAIRYFEGVIASQMSDTGQEKMIVAVDTPKQLEILQKLVPKNFAQRIHITLRTNHATLSVAMSEAPFVTANDIAHARFRVFGTKNSDCASYMHEIDRDRYDLFLLLIDQLLRPIAVEVIEKERDRDLMLRLYKLASSHA